MKITKTISVDLPGTTIKVDQIRGLIDGLDDNAVIRIHYHDYDNSPDPREHSWVTLKVEL